MRLVTIQPLEVLTILKKTGRFSCSYAETFGSGDNYDNYISNAYTWYIDQMKSRVGDAPEGVYHPIWAWYKNDDESLHDGSWGKAGEIYVRIEFEVEDERVLLSDYDEWRNPLNGIPCCDNTNDDTIRGSWAKIFDVSKSEHIQATLWELHSGDVLAVEAFASKGYLPR